MQLKLKLFRKRKKKNQQENTSHIKRRGGRILGIKLHSVGVYENQDPLGLPFLGVSWPGHDDSYGVLGVRSVLPSFCKHRLFSRNIGQLLSVAENLLHLSLGKLVQVFVSLHLESLITGVHFGHMTQRMVLNGVAAEGQQQEVYTVKVPECDKLSVSCQCSMSFAFRK